MTALHVFGQAVSKKRVQNELNNMNSFQDSHSAKIRQIVEGLSKHNIDSINVEIMTAYSPIVPMDERAKSAWRAVSYFKTINPYTHPKRKFFQRLDGLVDLIYQNPTSLSMYAVYVKVVPDQDIYDRLKSMDTRQAQAYLNYATTLKVADLHGINLDWMTYWT